jgi:putative endonuclease
LLKSGHVYLMANRRRGKIYLGVSSKLPQRVYQHNNGHFEGYSKDHGCHMLVWYEFHEDLQNARAREAQMKKWKREWKLKLIEDFNPEWQDLTDTLSV